MMCNRFITVWNNQISKTINTLYKIRLISLLLLGVFSCESSTQTPSVDEVYIIKKNHNYTCLKINKSSEKEIFYILNDYVVSKKEFVQSINLSENYTDSPILITKKDFNHLKKRKIKPN